MTTSYTHQEQAGISVHLWPQENRHPHYKTLTHNKTMDPISQNSNSISPKRSTRDVLKCDTDLGSTTPQGRKFQILTCHTLKNLFLISVDKEVS
jgi:hypothetical protein